MVSESGARMRLRQEGDRPIRIALLGAGGRVGAALKRIYTARGEEVLAFDRKALDITCPEAVERALGELEFDVLVNAAAQANVDACERFPREAMAVNAEAVRRLGVLCSERGVRCIHFSTDYVFDGERATPYTEEDEARPISIYGESKRAGEEALLAASPEHLVVRISWVFGPERPGFVEQTLERALRGEPLEGIDDKWSVPTSVEDIAAELHPFLREQPIGGVLHLTQGGPGCTWKEYAEAVVGAGLQAGLPLKSTVVKGRCMADIAAFVGRRPAYTVMATRRLEALSGRPPRPWRAALEEYIGGYRN